MTGAQLIALGHAALARSHKLILAGGALGLLSIVAGLISRRIGAPVLLVFLAVGMLAGDDHVFGVQFDDFDAAYLIGSVALAVILIEGGLKTPVSMLRLAFWPAAVLATIGVGVTAGILGAAVSLVDGVPVAAALLAGSAAAPTDAAAVAVLLRRAGAALPERLFALLSVESGLNDPMSVFLTFLLLRLIAEPGSIGVGGAVLLFFEEMVGGAALGVAGGWLLARSLKRLPIEAPLAPVLVLTGGLAVFGLAQLIGTSGFLATYLAAVITGATQHRAREDVEHFFEGMAWLAQIVLFLMLGLLVTPEDLPPYLPGAVIGAAVLILLARPVAVFACLLPFRFSLRETAFALLGRAARGGSDLPQHHPRIGRSATRPAAVRQYLYPGDRLAGRARLDRGASRPSARLWAPGVSSGQLPSVSRRRSRRCPRSPAASDIPASCGRRRACRRPDRNA